MPFFNGILPCKSSCIFLSSTFSKALVNFFISCAVRSPAHLLVTPPGPTFSCGPATLLFFLPFGAPRQTLNGWKCSGLALKWKASIKRSLEAEDAVRRQGKFPKCQLWSSKQSLNLLDLLPPGQIYHFIISKILYKIFMLCQDSQKEPWFYPRFWKMSSSSLGSHPFSKGTFLKAKAGDPFAKGCGLDDLIAKKG